MDDHSRPKTNITRRIFLKTAGIGSILVAGTAVWRAYDVGVFSTGQGVAYEPWVNWRTDKREGPLSLVRSSILAANPHNSQPWRFRLSESRIDLFADTARNIGTIDPRRREMHIGLGCAIENLLVAASAEGYAYQLHLMPDASDRTHIAEIDLSLGDRSESELYKAIPHRHTNRGPYDKLQEVSSETLKSFQDLKRGLPDACLVWFTSDEEKRRLSELIVEATEAIIADSQQSDDSSEWMRMTQKGLQEHRDGLTLDAMGFPWYVRAAAKFFPPLSKEKNDQAWLQSTRDTHVATAAAFGLIVVRDVEDQVQRVQGGMFYQRMHLQATNQKLGMHPLSQVTERADREKSLGIEPHFESALNELAGNPNWQILMIFRIGYPLGEALASPRRAVTEVLI